MTESVRKEVENLRAEIERHNQRYYVDADPEIGDEEFDGLLRLLQRLEAEHPDLVTPDSPTQRVAGQPLEGFETVDHRVPMLSMDNTYNPEELRDFHDRVVRLLDGAAPRYVAEPKIDGVSISLTYEAGRFVRGATRGDGRRGDDVTANLRTIRELPMRLRGPAPTVLEVRGEVYFTKSDFAEINRIREEKGEPTFANPRNTAAGTLKMLDPRIVASRPLRVFVWGVGYLEGITFESYDQALEELRRFGLPVNRLARGFDDFDQLLGYCVGWADQRHDLAYAVDGMVVKVDDFEQRGRLGATSKSPRWQVAYKYAAEQAVTRLEKIEVQVGKSGKLTPVAHLKPVLIAGTTVSRASLHNDEEVRRKDIRVGDLVVIEKAGEIIPQVVSVKTEQRTGAEQVFEFPTVCPVCGGEVLRDDGGVYLRCVDPACPAQFKNVLEFHAHRNAMDIEGLGPALIEQLVDKGLVRTIPDLYRLTEADLVDLERVGEKSAKNLVDAIAASKSRGLTRLLTGLAIRHVGRSAAEILAQRFGDIDRLTEADVETLEEIHDIGPEIAQSVHRFFHEQGGAELVGSLRELGVRVDEDVATVESEGSATLLAGKTLVVTGKLSRYSREQIHASIKAHGGKAASAVSSKTDYLVAGADAGSKLAKAKKLGVKALTEDEFLALIDSDSTE